MSEKRLVSNFLPAGGAFDPLANFEIVTYTGNGGTKKVNGYIKKGVAGFDDDQYITFPNITGVLDNSTNTDFAISLFFNLTSIPSSSSVFQSMFGKGNPTTSSNYQMLGLLLRGTSNTDEVGFELRRGYGGATYDGTSNPTTTLSTNTWYHLLINYTASTKVAEFFIDNTSIGSDTISSSASGRTIESGFNLGSYRVGVSSNLQGKVDQFRIFDTPITNSTNRQQLADEDYSKATKSTTDIFDDGSGIALYEFEDSANDTDGVDGKFNNAAIFNGSSSYIDINAKIPASLNFSVSFWFNSTSGQANGYIFSTKGNSATNGWWIVWNNTSNQYKINYGEGNGSLNAETITTSMTLNDGNWHHIVVTRAAGGTVNIYVDGNVDQQNASVGANYMTSSTWNNDLYIGRYSGLSPALYYNGLLDQIRIYDTALDSDDVAELYAESADVPTANLVAHYKLDGNANDQTGSYNGTASNITYTGYNGTPTNVDFLGMAFQPDFVWIKRRGATANHRIIDSVRGDDMEIFPNLTNAEVNNTGLNWSFDTNGFSFNTNGASYNASSGTYVAWCWKAGGTVSADNNSDGDITSTVSANPNSGFSIVSYTGNGGTTQSVGHGLSSAPELVLFKRTDATVNWFVFEKSGASTRRFEGLNTTNASTSDSFFTPSSSTITWTGTTGDFNGDENEYVMYCFHSVDSYQKVGTYSGGSTNTIVTGFQPRFVMVKRIDNTGNWYIYDSVRDSTNPIDKALFANLSNEESTGLAAKFQINFETNGFSYEGTTGGSINASGGTYIYLAIA